jgi:D-alanyl-D-alanine carboxypeptidase
VTRGVTAALFSSACWLSAATPSGAASAAFPVCRVADTLTQHGALADWSRSVVDTQYRLASTYAPTDLRPTSAAGISGGGSVRGFVIADLRAMTAAAKAAGAPIAVQSAYRSYATQQQTFAYWVNAYGYARALTLSARAGHSEHQLGTTLDLRSSGGAAPWDYADWGTTRAGAWLRANSWRYGFVMSYPKGQMSATCYAYEPWHFRYVGRARAKAVRDSGFTLRQYLWLDQRRWPS